MADDDYKSRVWPVFLGAKIAADRGTYAEQFEVVRRYAQSSKRLRLAFAGQYAAPRPDDDHPFERPAPFAPIHKGRIAGVAQDAVFLLTRG